MVMAANATTSFGSDGITLGVDVLIAILVLPPVVIFALGWCLGRGQQVNKTVKLERQAMNKQLEVIRKALDGQGSSLQYPFCVLRAQDFLAQRGLTSYEEMRRKGLLVNLDNVAQLKQFERKQRILFFSRARPALKMAGLLTNSRLDTALTAVCV